MPRWWGARPLAGMSVDEELTRPSDDGGELPFVLVPNIATAYVTGATSGSLATVGSMI